MVAVDQFVTDLKRLFKDVQKFLLENLEGYSMGAEDDNERDRLVANIQKLDEQAGSLSEAGPVEEANAQTTKTTEDEGIMEETYEDPYATKAPNEEKNEDGIVDEFYEDPYADRQIVQNPAPQSSDKKQKKEKKEKKKRNSEIDTISISSINSNEGTCKKMTAADFEDSDIYGPLRKQSGKSRNIIKDKNYWCAIKGGIFYYFEGKAKKHKGHFAIKDFTASELVKKTFLFQLTCPGRKTLCFCAQNEKEMGQWVAYINTGKLPEDTPSKSDSARATVPPPEVEGQEGVMEELYELEKPPQIAKPNIPKDEDEGEMEELYEDPGDYQDHKIQHSGGKVMEVPEFEEVYDDTIALNNNNTKPIAAQLSHHDIPNQPTMVAGNVLPLSPPPLPKRDMMSQMTHNQPNNPQGPPTEDLPQDVYDDTVTSK